MVGAQSSLSHAIYLDILRTIRVYVYFSDGVKNSSFALSPPVHMNHFVTRRAFVSHVSCSNLTLTLNGIYLYLVFQTSFRVTEPLEMDLVTSILEGVLSLNVRKNHEIEKKEICPPPS